MPSAEQSNEWCEPVDDKFLKASRAKDDAPEAEIATLLTKQEK